VTGFGVMGHLLEMMKYGELDSNTDSEVCKLPSTADRALEVSLALGSVPTLDGAKDCVRDGVLSSLHPQVYCRYY
jgi:selenophosphate synthase